MVDWEKPIQTRDGRKARFLAKLKGVDSPYVVAVDQGSSECIRYHYEHGGFWAECPHQYDIINVPETVERWVNVYDAPEGYLGYPDKDTARETQHDGFIGLVKLTIVDGKLERSDVVKDEDH